MISCNNCCGGRTVNVTYCECVFVLRFPACNAQGPHCHLRPARLYNIFPLYLTYGTIFGKKMLLNIQCSFQLFTVLPVTLLGAFTKLRKATIIFVMSVRLSAWNNSAPWTDFNEIWYLSIFRKSVEKTQFH